MAFITLHVREADRPEVVVNTDTIIKMQDSGRREGTRIFTTGHGDGGPYVFTVAEPLDVVMDTIRRNG